MQEIEDSLGGKMEVQEWLAMIVQPPKGTLHAMEQRGFTRLLSGYRAAASEDSLVSHFETSGPPLTSA